MNVELIYDADCPNVAPTRSLLIKAFAKTGASARWREWERMSPDSPEYGRRYGSPTLLVDGSDIVGFAPSEGAPACRVYGDGRGKLGRTPQFEAVCSALLNASSGKPTKTRWPALTASLPAIGTALLPKLTCPLCWPAYTALLSAMGVGFINYTPYLLPLMTVFLVITLVLLGRRARTRHGFGPFALGCIATAIILIGKFWLDSDPALYGGVVLLVGASLWNVWPKVAPGSCPTCVPAGSRSIDEHELDGAQIK
jgi:mercuric ion transport protein